MIPNAQPTQSAQQPPFQEDDDGIGLLDLLDVVLDHRWLIAAISAVVVVIGGAYAWMAAPVYEANTLVQIEDFRASSTGGALGQAEGLFEVRSPTSAEIEILRSRLVIGQAVDNLRLDLEVAPNYLPVVGRWLARRADGPSEPGLMGLPGYVYGNEKLSVGAFEIPRELHGRRYSVVLTEDGFALYGPDGERLAAGRPGEPLRFTDLDLDGSITVTDATGRPGAEFFVRRASRQGLVGSLQARLKIAEQGRGSGVLRVSLEDTDPARAARVLNEIGALYVRQNVERKSAEAEKTLAFLDSQLPQLRQELEASERRLNAFRAQNRFFDLGSEASNLLGQSVSLNVKLLELQQKRRELEARYTPEHPAMQTIDAQIREMRSRVGEVDGRTRALPSVEQDLLGLTRDVKINSELYTSLLNSFQTLRLVKEGKVGNVRIIDAADVPGGAIAPSARGASWA